MSEMIVTNQGKTFTIKVGDILRSSVTRSRCKCVAVSSQQATFELCALEDEAPGTYNPTGFTFELTPESFQKTAWMKF